MTHEQRSIQDILRQDPEMARADLQLTDHAQQDEILRALTIAHRAVQTLDHMGAIEKLYALVPAAQTIAQDFTHYAQSLLKSQWKLGEKVDPHQEAEQILFGGDEPAIVTYEAPDERQRRINSLAKGIEILNKANDMAMNHWIVSEVRGEVVEAFFKDNLKDYTGNLYNHKFAKATLPLHDPLLDQTFATEELADYYKMTETIAVVQQTANEYMKVPDWFPVGESYKPIFQNQAADSLEHVAQSLRQINETLIAGKIIAIVDGIHLDNGNQQQRDLSPFVQKFIANYDAVASMANMMLDPGGLREMPYWGRNDDFIDHLEGLTILANGDRAKGLPKPNVS